MKIKELHQLAYNQAVRNNEYLLITVERGSVTHTSHFYQCKTDRDHDATRFYHLGDRTVKYNPDIDFEIQWQENLSSISVVHQGYSDYKITRIERLCGFFYKSSSRTECWITL